MVFLYLISKGCAVSYTHLDVYKRQLIESGTVLKKKTQFGKYVSFFSLEGDMPGLTLVGFKYPLNHYHLRFSDSGLTVSNEIEAEEAVVSFDGKTLLMLMTRD